MLLRLLFLSAALGAVCPFSVCGAQVGSTVKLDKTDKDLLKEPISYDITFPDNSENPQKNEAAKFLNEILKTNPNSYDTLLKALIAKDKQLSSTDNHATIPGSFLNSAADLYANVQIDTSTLTGASTENQTAAKIKGEQELLAFASLLQKEAKIANQSANNLEDRVAALEKALAKAKAEGKLPPKVYIYSDSPAERVRYIEVVRGYYRDPNATLVYNVVPSVYDPGYINGLTGAAVGFGLGWVFFGHLPWSYPPFWAPIWHPFFHALPVGCGVYSGWGGRPYNVTNYVHNNFNKTVVNNGIIHNRSNVHHFARAVPNARIGGHFATVHPNAARANVHNHAPAHPHTPHNSAAATHPSMVHPPINHGGGHEYHRHRGGSEFHPYGSGHHR